MNDNETTQELYPKYPHIEEANKGIEYRNNKRKEFCEILTEYCEEKLDQENINRKDLFSKCLSNLNKRKTECKSVGVSISFLKYDTSIVRMKNFDDRIRAETTLRQNLELISTDYEKMKSPTLEDILGEKWKCH